MKFLTVKDIEEWAKSVKDKSIYVLIGNDDPMGGTDMNIEKVTRKAHGFGDDDRIYYVLCGRQAKAGCMKI